MSEPPTLARRLGLGDAVVVGLGSMIGAGVFAAFTPAAAAAGGWLLAGLAAAALVAWCNATSSAQLAAQYPTSGGTYVYGRERLGPVWGFVAGWGFVVGKTASCAAMAMTVGTYAAPGSPWLARAVGVGAVVALTAVNLRGITKTAAVARVLVTITLAGLLVVLAAIATAAIVGPAPISAEPAPATDIPTQPTAYGILQSAGLLFFAFAGYARIATLGEEVRDPARVIPRAVTTALAIVVALYAVVGVVLLWVLGPAGVAGDPTPLAAAGAAVGPAWLAGVVRVTAVIAAAGALLGLIAGVSRTALAMGRERDLPGWFAAVDPSRAVPRHAELAVGAVVTTLVALGDLRHAIGFSSFGVLVYYAVANASAWTQRPPHRRRPRAVQALGVVGCLTLVATLPIASVVTGVAVLALGLTGRAVLRR